jgi:hypothetical protein
MELHLTHSAVGSEASGSGSGGVTPLTGPPAATVSVSKVVPQFAQTWLKQQPGVQL